MSEEKDPINQLEEMFKEFWKEKGNTSIIAAKHTEFTVEPKIFIGDKLNPEILKLLVINYLVQSTKQDSGIGANIEVSPERLVIKTPKGKPLVIVSDKNLIQQYLAARA
ncbi:MAG: hypothetical protein PHG97_00750 [Candidatus Margulisbacteria bacterium]|nr:hypothetical protein [Candidatus Margulisiibacteriota bacterium]